jgi:hypothetical protein
MKPGIIVGIVIAALFLLGVVYCILIRWATSRTRSEPEDEDAPPPYNAANRSSQSSTASTPDPTYFIASSPPNHRAQMANFMPSPVTYTSRNDTTQSGGESLHSTPAQRYRDSARVLLVGDRSSRGSVIGTCQYAFSPCISMTLTYLISTPSPSPSDSSTLG